MTIPYDIDYGLRNSVLSELAADVVAAGGTLTGLDIDAGETHPNWVFFLNQISAAMNALGATPPLPIYQWLDRNSFGSVVANILSAVVASPPVNITSPSVMIATGTGVAGATTLARNVGSWSGEPTYTQQWLSDGTAIVGQTGTTYVTQASDSGATISCTVTATNAGGSTSATSNGVALT